MILIGIFAPAVMAAWWLRMRGPADERGETTEKVIITALFAALALTAATIITLKVTDKANSIPTDPSVTTPSNGNGGTLGP
ncbi:MAG: hypothetical protein ACRD03_12255 [Acidimicrobiales bacterium]